MIRKKIIRTGKKIYSTARLKRKQRKLIRFIDREIARSDDPIPQLTAEQEKTIRDYWQRYGFSEVPTQWHRFYYAKTGQERPEFVPSTFFFLKIKTAMNNVEYGRAWSDKSYLDFFLQGLSTAKSVLRNVNGVFLDEQFRLLSMEEAAELLDRYEELVVKPSVDTHTGHGVALLKRPYQLKELAAQYRKDYVFQLPLRQHPEMARLNASSVNTIRMNTVLLGTRAHVMSAFVKVGQAGEFADNHGSDRFFIGVGEDGVYRDYAIDHSFRKYDSLPSGFAFQGQRVPNYEKVCELVCRAHERLPRFGFAFWDVCIAENGDPAIVEVNLKNPDAMVPQVACGPFFGKYTNEILEKIAKKNGC